jgi:serine/threonine-protein kinase PknK
LESAHRLKVVHRDVKPANILFTDYGEPALSDFGIARTEVGFQTAGGVFVGSPAFTAPEVLAGDAVTAASDVYGLGATLFAGLTGHAAFERQAGEGLPDLHEHGVPQDVVALVEQAMAREPAARPSAVELGRGLQQLQARHGLAVAEMVVHGAAGRPAGVAAPVVGRGLSDKVPRLPYDVVGRRGELAQLRRVLATSALVTGAVSRGGVVRRFGCPARRGAAASGGRRRGGRAR